MTGFYSLDSNEYGRGLAFFDAIYGFSATLLIANLDAPPADAWRSWDALTDSGVVDQLYGFVLSFVVIVAFWRANVRLMSSLTGLDNTTMTANLVAVGLVILLPFTTQGISDEASNGFALPTVVYALNIALISVTFIVMTLVAKRRGLERDDLSAAARRWDLISAAVIPAVFLASIPVALAFGPVPAQWCWLALAFLMPLMGWLSKRAGA